MFKLESLFKKIPKIENIPENVSALIRQKVMDELGSNYGQEAQKLGNDSNYKFLSEQQELLFEKRIKDLEYVRKITEEIQRKEITNKKSPEELAIEAEKIKEHNLRKDQRFTHSENIRKALKSHIEEKYPNEDKNI